MLVSLVPPWGILIQVCVYHNELLRQHCFKVRVFVSQNQTCTVQSSSTALPHAQPLHFLNVSLIDLPALISSIHLSSTSRPFKHLVNTTSANSLGTHTTPSKSAKITSPGFTSVLANLSPSSPTSTPLGSIRRGMFNSEGRENLP